MRDLSNKDRLINGPVEYPEFRLRWFLISVAGRKVVFQVCEVCAIQKTEFAYRFLLGNSLFFRVTDKQSDIFHPFQGVLQ